MKNLRIVAAKKHAVVSGGSPMKIEPLRIVLVKRRAEIQVLEKKTLAVVNSASERRQGYVASVDHGVGTHTQPDAQTQFHLSTVAQSADGSRTLCAMRRARAHRNENGGD